MILYSVCAVRNGPRSANVRALQKTSRALTKRRARERRASAEKQHTPNISRKNAERQMHLSLFK